MKTLYMSIFPFTVALLFLIPLYVPSTPQLFSQNFGEIGHNGIKYGINDDVDFWAVTITTDSVNTNECYIYDALRLSCNWNSSHIKLLSDENTTKSMILSSIAWLRDHADENDIVVFSFHGHGSCNGTYWGGTYGIVAYDGGMITREELDARFDEIHSGGLCLIFNCCLSGNLVNPRGTHWGNHECDFFEKFSCGLEGDSRVVLMSTLRYGLGFSDSINQIYFSRFVAEAFTTQVDYNNDGFTSAEEAFNYSHDKFYPYAYEMLLSPLFQIFSLINTGFLILAFPTLYDTYPGDLPIIYHEEL